MFFSFTETNIGTKLTMAKMKKVTKDISQSSTLPADFYFDEKIWEQMKEEVFAKSWQYIGDESEIFNVAINTCLLYTSPSPRDRTRSRMPSSA